MRQKGEMCFSDAGPNESPDLGLWEEFLDPEDIIILRVMKAEEHGTMSGQPDTIGRANTAQFNPSRGDWNKK